MSRGLLSHLRIRLLILIVFATLPGFGLTLYAGVREQARVTSLVQNGALRLARFASLDQDRVVEGVHQLLASLAQFPQVRSSNPESCGILFADLLEQFPLYANFGVIGMDGNVLCSGLPFTSPVNLADRPYFQRAREARGFAIGDYQIGRITGIASLNFGYPVFDAEGDMESIVFAAIDLTWFNQLAVQAQLPAGSILMMMDHNGTILAHYPDSEAWVGQTIPDEPLVRTILSEGEGTTLAAGPDDFERVYGFARLDGALESDNLYITVGVPKEVAFAESNFILSQGLGGLIVVFLVVFAAAWLGNNLFILRPVDSLLRATERLQQGDLSARVGIRGGIGEVHQLAGAFDEMASSLQMRMAEQEKTEKELRASEEKYHSLYSEMREGVALHELVHDEAGEVVDYVVLDVNPAYEAITGLTPEQAIGERATILYGVEPPPYLDIYAKVVATQQATMFEAYFAPMDKHFSISAFSPREGRFATVFSDVTERKRNEQALQRYNERLKTLRAIDTATLMAQSGETVIRLALQSSLLHSPLLAANIVIFDFEAREGLVFASHGDDDHIQGANSRFSLQSWSEEDIASLWTGTAQLITDSTTPSRLPPGVQLLGPYGPRAYLRVPLIAEDDLIGTLNLGADDGGVFTPEYIEIAHEIADQVAIAIQQARLREQIERHTAELEHRVLERTVELQGAKERVEAILNSTSDSILLVGADLAIQQTNRMFDTLFGYAPDELFGQPLTRIIEEDQAQQLTDAIHTVVDFRQPSRIEVVARRKDGASFDADVAMASSEEGGGIRAKVICSLRDISVHKHLEAELRQAVDKEKELNALKSRFVSMVSHEFRTPLASILSSNDLLKTYGDRLSDEKKAAHLDTIATQVRRLTGLLDGILTLSRAESVGLEVNPIPLDLEAFCRSLVEEIRVTTQATHQLVFSTHGLCREFVGDEKLLRQIVSNLLTNATKYSPQGSTVAFNLACEEDRAVIRVKDEGIGIPEEDQKRLFETFHRAGNVGHIPGTGLGLVIVKQAVDTLGGTIAFESEVGVGTTFTVRLPMSTSP